ncbi:MAG: thermonuclease family protein [Defluviicoccus sp.]|nr:thermonuclease family protein [Defluviicoccus sp.]MDE0383063.1 thermonuclease family protein [Defluviicoccus sp.]
MVDSDTVAVDASADMPAELADVKVRLRGVDTPDTWKPKCDAERAAGTAATAFTNAAIADADIVTVRDPAWGKWGGRVVADLIVDGDSLAELLIEAGHGRAYDGRKRQSWCR